MVVGFQDKNQGGTNQNAQIYLKNTIQFEELTSWTCEPRQFKAAEKTTE